MCHGFRSIIFVTIRFHLGIQRMEQVEMRRIAQAKNPAGAFRNQLSPYGMILTHTSEHDHIYYFSPFRHDIRPAYRIGTQKGQYDKPPITPLGKGASPKQSLKKAIRKGQGSKTPRQLPCSFFFINSTTSSKNLRSQRNGG